jgi:Tol biopolymer transport system component
VPPVLRVVQKACCLESQSLHAPAWSPDGKRIAVYSLEDGSLNISVPNAP